jgi:hypothetical protein
MFPTKFVGKIKMHFVFNNIFFENLTICEVMSKKDVKPDRPQMTIGCTLIACWITKATNTPSGYVILITFPLQLCLKNAPQCCVMSELPLPFDPAKF